MFEPRPISYVSCLGFLLQLPGFSVGVGHGQTVHYETTIKT